MKHLIDPMDLSVEDIDRLLDRADDIAKNPEKYQEVCKHKKLATLFFEPSTRTSSISGQQCTQKRGSIEPPHDLKSRSEEHTSELQ